MVNNNDNASWIQGRGWFGLGVAMAILLGAVLPAWLMSSAESEPQNLHGWNLLSFGFALLLVLLVMGYLLVGYLAAVINAVYGQQRIEIPGNLFYLPGRNLRPLVGALVVTALLTEGFAIGYRLISSLQGCAAFQVGGKGAVLSFFDAFYFSAVTLATVGFGDIVPVSRSAKLLVMAEIFVSLANVTFVLSAVVTALRERP